MRPRRVVRWLGIGTVMAVAISLGTAGAQTLTMESLLREMVDMQRLSRMPEPYYDSDQWSSYDRRSVAPDKEGWFENADAGQFIRQGDHNGRTEWVMAEMDGPGVICRIWSANPDGGGNIRIYIDDMETPAIEQDFLKLTSGEMAEFPAPFSHRLSLGANLYLPIPYQTRCKCTVDKPGLYYQIDYRTYPKGRQVEPFSMAALAKVKATMDEVGAVLADPSARRMTTRDWRTAKEWTIASGKSETLKLSGEQAIVRTEARVEDVAVDGKRNELAALRARYTEQHPYVQTALKELEELEKQAPEQRLFAALRESLLTIRFDGEDAPCVWAPLGDFFGSTPGVNPYASLPVGMTADGLCYANWYMPFNKRAEITVKNESANPVKLRLAVYTRPGAKEWIPGKSLYFHAKWRNEWLPAEPQFLDWRMLQGSGPGRFVGVMLGVMNTQQGWWGEGDEKVWVDDDTFPSYIGTGSEDYFGYAWCNPTPFTHAYHNQSLCTGPGNFGYTAVARYHILDDIPFRKSMKFDIEKWDAADREYCCTTYWYAAPGARDFFKPIPVDERRVRPLPELFRVKGAREGEDLEVARCTGGQAQVQDVGLEFSNQRHRWWTNPNEGDILELKVPVAEAARYKVTLGLTKSWDYGIHQPMVNGQDVGEPVDLYTPPPFRPLKVELGEMELKAGDNLIGLRCVGTNPEAKPVNHMAGIDYVLLERVESRQ